MDKIIVILAVIPGLFLTRKVYKLDKIESEPKGLLIKLFFLGVLSTIPAVILETLWEGIFGELAIGGGRLYSLVENIIGIALMEEFSKYILLKRGSFKHKAFNYSFDGIVYAVCVGAGFAVCENIIYAMEYGLATTLVRAITAVPAHIIFAIFMGYYYGLARYYKNIAFTKKAKANLRKAVWVPVLIHGLYDFLASDGTVLALLVFFVFVLTMDVIAYRKIKKFAAADQPIA